MKKEKGFTLAEILIVLTVIGVMAVMTIPSLMQNANSQQKIAMFKKAFNAVSNAYATEFALKSAPKTSNDRAIVFEALANQLNVKYYYNHNTNEKVFTKPAEGFGRYSIVTEDGISYHVTYSAEGLNCISKLTLNSLKTTNDINSTACIIIYAKIDDVTSTNYGCSDKDDLTRLKCNRTIFYVAKDGITSGNPDCTISGRIISDNTIYDEEKCK